MAKVSEKVRDISRNTGVSPALRYISQNPMAFGLMGAGVGLLLASGGKSTAFCSTRSYGKSGSSASGDSYRGSEYVKGASQAASDIRDKAMGAAASAGRQAKKAGQQVRSTAQSASGHAASAFDSNPLLLGLAALAAGAVVGLALPSTQLEGEYLGEASEQVINRAKSAVQETADRAQRAAQDTGRELKQKAKEAIGVSSQSDELRKPQIVTY